MIDELVEVSFEDIPDWKPGAPPNYTVRETLEKFMSSDMEIAKLKTYNGHIINNDRAANLAAGAYRVHVYKLYKDQMSLIKRGRDIFLVKTNGGTEADTD